MKKVLIGLALVAITASGQKLNLRKLGKKVVNQASRQSSCTYRLTVVKVTSNQFETVKRRSATVNEACAIAENDCHTIGAKKGFFGEHSCEKVNHDDGGIITRVVEGNISQRKAPNPHNNKPVRRSRKSNHNEDLAKLKKENTALRQKITAKDSTIRSLRLDLAFEVDTKILKAKLKKVKEKLKKVKEDRDNLNNLVSTEQRTIFSLKEEIVKLKRDIHLLDPDQDLYEKPSLSAGQIQACDYATSSVDMGKCLKLSKMYELSAGVIGACNYATSSNNLSLCLEVVGKININNAVTIIKECDYATSNVQDLVSCIEYAL